MNLTIDPRPLKGRVTVPASKSAAHRLLICAALADRPGALGLSGMNADIDATLNALRALGAGFEWTESEGRRALNVSPTRPSGSVQGEPIGLDCGESGSTLRFLLPLACALGVRARLTGHGRLPGRPNGPLAEALRAHGASIDADTLPMLAEGPLTGGVWTLPGNVSSQYVTGLLFALPLLESDSEIVLTTRLESAAYVDMTLSALRRFGVRVEPTPTGWRVHGRQKYLWPRDEAVDVEGDWSAAAFWLAANAMGSEIDVRGLREDTAQGDRAVRALLHQSHIDASNVPDLVPALAVAAAVRPGRTTITGAARLRLKESDRLETVHALLSALGAEARITPDGLIIEGGAPIRGGTVDGAGDHRVVMAAAILATRSSGPVTITGAEAVAKSYPDFFRDYQSLGGQIHVESSGQ